MRLGHDTASLMNHVMATSRQTVPVVGAGATVLGWTDRRAGTIVSVSESVDRFTVQLDHAVRADHNGMSEDQRWTHSPNPEGALVHFARITRGKNRGLYSRDGKAGGQGVLIGVRRHYHDFSF